MYKASSTDLIFLNPLIPKPATITPNEAFASVSIDSNGFCCALLSEPPGRFALNVLLLDFFESSGFISFSGALFFSFSLLASSGDILLICLPFDKRDTDSVNNAVKPVVSIIPKFELFITFCKAPNVTRVIYALRNILLNSCLNLIFFSLSAFSPSSSIILDRLYASFARKIAGGIPETILFNERSCLVS